MALPRPSIGWGFFIPKIAQLEKIIGKWFQEVKHRG